MPIFIYRNGVYQGIASAIDIGGDITGDHPERIEIAEILGAGGEGTPGPQGDPGADGADGADGSGWLGGVGVPSNLIGDDGDYYYNQTNGDIYFKGSGNWSQVGSILGPAGADGADGSDGADGAQGIQGIQGIQGTAGADGADGADGAQGIQGIQGIQGPQGDPGSGGAPIDAWPIGSIFIAAVSTDPATLLGGGTWASFGAGRVLVGFNASDTDFDTAEETGGAKTKAISAHAGTAVGTSGAGSAHSHTGPSHTHDYTQVPNHVHVQSVNSATTGGTSGYTPDTSTNTSVSSGYSTANPTGGVATGTTVAGGTGSTGNESAHTHAAGTVTQPSAHSDLNVVQPYITVYMWKRTA